MNTTAIIVMIVMLAVLVEYLTNVIKPLIPESKYPIPLLISMCFGVGLALLTSINILTALGYTVAVPTIGQIVTGLIVSGGSTGVHELIAKLRESRKSQ